MIVALAIIFFLYLFWKEKQEKPYPLGSVDNSALYQEDRLKVSRGEMTHKELEFNIYNGKYRTDGKTTPELEELKFKEKRRDKCLNAMKKQWDFFTEEQIQTIEKFLRC